MVFVAIRLSRLSRRLRNFADDLAVGMPHSLTNSTNGNVTVSPTTLCLANAWIIPTHVLKSLSISPKARDPYVFVPFGFCQRQLFEFSRGIHRDHLPLSSSGCRFQRRNEEAQTHQSNRLNSVISVRNQRNNFACLLSVSENASTIAMFLLPFSLIPNVSCYSTALVAFADYSG